MDDEAARHASRKAAWHLIPFLILCWLISILDRVNVGFAALTMNKELGLTAEMFGFGAGIFFFGYFIFEVPSNLILERVGARRWIARIMISWGVIAASFAFVPSISAVFQGFGFSFFNTARTFYLMRFIFGAAEAGPWWMAMAVHRRGCAVCYRRAMGFEASHGQTDRSCLARS